MFSTKITPYMKTIDAMSILALTLAGQMKLYFTFNKEGDFEEYSSECKFDVVCVKLFDNITKDDIEKEVRLQINNLKEYKKDIKKII